MSNAQKAINQVLIHEGGYVNHPNDRGGATNWGITKRVYEEFMNRSVSLDEMKNMPKGNAYTIYKEKYWDKVKGDEIKSYAKSYALFDQAVNRGHVSAIKQAQKILGITQDGIIGPQTLKHINESKDKDFINKYLGESENFYRTLASNDPSQMVFLNGWLNRVSSIYDHVSPYMKASVAIGLLGSFLVLGFTAYKFYNRRNANA